MQGKIRTIFTFKLIYSCFTLFLLSRSSLVEGLDNFTTKSGKEIDLSYFRRYIQLGDEPNLELMVFERDTSSNTLFSYNRSIKLPDVSTRSRIVLDGNEKIVFDINGGRKNYAPSNDTKIFMSKSENGDTFLFDANKNYSILGAFGNTLDIHSIHHPDYEVYINHYIPTVPPTIDNSANAVPQPKKCKQKYQFTVHVVFDEAICERFNKSPELTFYMIEQFLFQSRKMFMDLLCVDIQLIALDAFCDGTRRFDWNKSNCRKWDDSENRCLAPLPKYIMEEIIDFPDYFESYREFYMFISGLNTSGSLAGLAYKAKACDVLHSSSWIKGLSQLAFYHEIGHLLGANHSPDGIMQPRIQVRDGLSFSKKSNNEMNRFIKKDPRSSCLRKELSQSTENSQDDWINKTIFLPNRTELKPPTLLSISLTSLSNHDEDSLAVFIGNGSDFTRGWKLFYGYITNIWTRKSFSCESDIDYKPLGVEFPESPWGFHDLNLRVFRRSTSGSKGILLAYRENIKRNGTYHYWPFYRIGSVKSNGDVNVESWSKPRSIGNYEPVLNYATGFTHTTMNTGNVMSKTSVDILYMHLDVPDLYVGLPFSSTLKYKFGFNMSAIGEVQNGWSDFITVPGEFYFARRISAVIMDIDGNGKPDLIISIVEPYSKYGSRAYTYFRVGKDLNQNGVVDGGWADYKMTRNSEGFYNYDGYSIDIGKNFRSGRTEIISSEPRDTVRFNDKALSQEFMRTAKKYSSIEPVTSKCEMCYDGKTVETCKDELYICRSRIDELQISQYPFETSSKIKTAFGKFGNGISHPNQSFNRTVHTSIMARRENHLKKSIYCQGFHYFLSQHDPCETIDGKSVYSKGLEITFTKYLTENINEKDVNSSSMFEDTLGIAGNSGKPIIVQATIRGKRTPTKKKISKALRKVYARARKFPSFNSLNGKQLFKTSNPRWIRKRSLWVINFHFLQPIDDVY